MVKGIQPICFENAAWAYVVGAALAIKRGCKNAADAAEVIGEGLQAFCIKGSVADDRKVGLGHGNLGAMLLRGNKVLCIPGRSRVFCGSRGRNRYCKKCKQS